MGDLHGGLFTEKYDRTYSDRDLVRRIFDYFRPQLRKMLIVAVLVALASTLQAAMPILLARGIDDLVLKCLATLADLGETGRQYDCRSDAVFAALGHDGRYGGRGNGNDHEVDRVIDL